MAIKIEERMTWPPEKSVIEHECTTLGNGNTKRRRRFHFQRRIDLLIRR
jgi:hypothetical protein